MSSAEHGAGNGPGDFSRFRFTGGRLPSGDGSAGGKEHGAAKPPIAARDNGKAAQKDHTIAARTPARGSKTPRADASHTEDPAKASDKESTTDGNAAGGQADGAASNNNAVQDRRGSDNGEGSDGPRGSSPAEDGTGIEIDPGVNLLLDDLDSFLEDAVASGETDAILAEANAGLEARKLLQSAESSDPDTDLAPQEEDGRTQFEKLSEDKERAAKNVAQIAQKVMRIAKDDEVSFGDDYSQFWVSQTSLLGDELAPGVESPVGTCELPKQLVVSSTHMLAYPDDKSPEQYASVSLEVDFIYEILPGHEEEPQFVTMRSNWLDTAGEENEQAKSVFVREYDVDGSLQGHEDEAEKTVAAIIASGSAQQAEFKYITDISDGSLGEGKETEQSEKEILAQKTRGEVLASQALKLDQQSEEALDAYSSDAGEAVVNLLVLYAGKTTKGIAQREDASGEASSQRVSLQSLRRKIDTISDVPPTISTRVALVGAELLLEGESREYLVAKLAHERDTFAARADDPVYAGRKPELLEAVVKECERIGVDPSFWINGFSGSEDARWEQWFNHYARLSEQGVAVSKDLSNVTSDLLEEGVVSNKTIIAVMPKALTVTKNIDTRAKLLTRFTEVMKSEYPSYEHFTRVLSVGKVALHDAADNETITQLDNFIDEIASALPQELLENAPDRAKILQRVAIEQQKWRIMKKVATGEDSEMISNYITNKSSTPAQIDEDDLLYREKATKEQQPEESAAVDQNMLFITAADEYVKRGDLENAQKMLEQVEPEQAAKVYQRYWYGAEDAGVVRVLHPYNHTWSESTEFIESDYQEVSKLFTADTKTLVDKAEAVAVELRDDGETLQDMEHGNPRWQKLDFLRKRIKAVAGKDNAGKGKEAAQVMSMRVLEVFSQKGTMVAIDNLSPFIEEAAESGNQDAIDTVFGIIAAQPISDVAKARLFTEFALKLH